MPKPNTTSAASFVLTAAIVLTTWLPTVSTPRADPLPARAFPAAPNPAAPNPAAPTIPA